MARTQQQKYEFARQGMAWCRRGMLWLAVIVVLVITTMVAVRKLQIEMYLDDMFPSARPVSLIVVCILTRWFGGRLYPDQMIPGLFWFISLMIFLGLGMLWFRRMAQRNAPGQCPKCGYDLRGTLTAGRTACPECGNPVESPANPTR